MTAIANPQATSSGQVVNQAVQVMQGPYATNNYGGGVSCQGPTLNVTPFLFGSRSGQTPFEDYADIDNDPNTGHNGLERTGQKNSWSLNPGISMTFSVPLDNSLQDRCKRAADVWATRQQAEADKARLDFELVRLIRCGEALQKGIFFHPDSPYSKVCADVQVQRKLPPVVPARPSVPSENASQASSTPQSPRS